MVLHQSVEIAVDGQIYEVKPHVKDDIYRLLRPYVKSARDAVTRKDLQKVAPVIFERLEAGGRDTPKPKAEKMPPGVKDVRDTRTGLGAPPMKPTVTSGTADAKKAKKAKKLDSRKKPG